MPGIEKCLIAEPVHVQCSEIDLQDFSLSVTAGRETAALEASLRAVGMINPPLFARKRKGEGYRVVCGMLRIKAARASGMTSFAARVAAADTDEQVLVLTSLADNASHRVFNPVEHARAAALLAETFPDDEALRLWNQLLGMPRARVVFDRYKKIAYAGETLHALLLKGAITVDTAFILIQMEDDDRAGLCDLFSRLHFSARAQAEILEYCDDICRRDGIAPGAVLEKAGVPELLGTATPTTRAAVAERVRKRITELRFPHRTDREHRVREALKKLRLPPTLRIEPPPYFEGDNWTLMLQVSSPYAVRDAAARLEDLASNPTFSELFQGKKICSGLCRSKS